MSKKEKVFIGIGKDLKEHTIDVADIDPKPWDGKSDLKYIGKDIPRIDGKFKTSGRAKYTFDVKLPGMIYGKILRSPHAAAKVTSIDTSLAQKAAGVRAIVNVHDELPFQVRFAGQEVLAIAADTKEQAEEAANLVKVTYEKLPFAVTLEDAMKKDAAAVFDDIKLADENGSKNIREPRVSPRDKGPEETDAALKSSEVVVEETYKTQVQTHSTMETHGVVAQWKEDRVTV